MKKPTVLVVDDEPDICELLSMTLTRMGLECEIAVTLQEAINAVNTRNFSLILSDMRLPDGEGINLVKHVQRIKSQIPIAVITAFGNMEGAVNTLKAGAFDYVSKPVNVKLLKELVKTALSMEVTMPMVEEDHSLIGQSKAMQELRVHINKLARSLAPVFIHGESGVGKELVAQLIHKQGPRHDRAFIPVNCGAMPSELMESEFFGHKKGSFTGAIADKEGLFLAANGGTLFLDEIAELPISMQVKLLRAIQEKAIKPVGSHQEISVDVRILSASHKDLQQEIQSGRFRKDLYYRVNVIELRVPTLAERIEDIPELTDSFLKKIARDQHIAPIEISKACLDRLQQYSFPGNVRELENILERAVALCEGNKISIKDLHLPQQRVEDNAAVSAQNLNETLTEHEKELILEALEQTKWNRTAAARLLGISFRTLRYRLKKYGID